MTSRTKLSLAGVSAAGAVGLWLGYTKAAFFLPGWTLQRARSCKRAGAARLPSVAQRRGARLKYGSSARSNRAGGTWKEQTA